MYHSLQYLELAHGLAREKAENARSARTSMPGTARTVRVLASCRKALTPRRPRHA
jgi:hypothetical protein